MKSFESVILALVISAALSACTQGSDPAAPGDGSNPGGPPPATGSGTIDPVNGFLTTSSPIQHTAFSDGANLIPLQLAAGTVAFSANITVDGLVRRYVVIRPDPAPANAPVLLLLHPFATAPEDMANLTEVSDYAVTQGFWAVLPEARNGTWNQDPSAPKNEDVPFISALIDSLVANNGVDRNRIYAAGFSDGGFMTERLACDLSDKIAAFGIDAATLRSSLAAVCAPTTLRSKIYFLGTADLVVAYNGVLGGTANGLRSAADTLAYWVAQQRCGGIVATDLPNLAPNDGTTVQENDYTGCTAGTALQLYTINGGGHAWPGGQPTFTGLTTQDIQATGLIWRFVSGYRR